ncbi:MAG: hypothetical protein ABUL77_01990 [Bacteroidota bacterium]
MKRVLLALLLAPIAACASGGSAAGPAGLALLGPDAGNERLRAGHALFSAACQRCHALPHPARITPEAWPAEVAGMAKKSGLSSEQSALITDYLVAASRRATAPAEIQVVSR